MENKIYPLMDDLGGYENQKEEARKIIYALTHYKECQEAGIYLSKGVIISGPAGTGKTTLAKIIANESGANFYAINSAKVESGRGLIAQLSEILSKARENVPAIVFLDEIDTWFEGDLASKGLDFSLFKKDLLDLLDGLERNDGLIVIATANNPYVIPNVVKRPGRFDKGISFDYPTLKERKDILNYYLGNLKLNHNIDLGTIVRLLKDSTGADIKTLINEAALNVYSTGKEKMETIDLIMALASVISKSTVSKEKDKKEQYRTAIHEVGHMIVDKVLFNKINYLYALDMGDIKGFNAEMDEPIAPSSDMCEEKTSYANLKGKNIDENYFINSICMLLGGWAAEKVFFKSKVNVGAGQDILQARALMDRILSYGYFGLAKEVYPGSFDDITRRNNYLKYKRLFRKIMKKTMNIIKKNKKAIKAVAIELAEKSILSPDEIKIILDDLA